MSRGEIRIMGLQRVNIEQVGDGDAAAWDAFVDASPAGTFFHRWGWGRAIARGLGHEPIYLAARDGGRIVGVLPLIHKRSPLFKNALISVAFGSYGGCAAESVEIATALEAEAVRRGEQLAVDYVELRELDATRGAGEGWVVVDNVHATFPRKLFASEEETLKAIPRKGRRYEVKKSLKGELAFTVGGDFEVFYDVMAQSYRNLGTPMFAKKYLRALLEEFPEHFDVCIAARGAEGVSASMAFRYKGAIHPYYTGGTLAARSLSGNDFLFINLMRHGRERGCDTFDFGRSKFGTGSFDYKRYWGFEPKPLAYRYKLLKLAEAPSINPLNPKYRLFIEAWKRLPLPVANFVGPFLSRQVG